MKNFLTRFILLIHLVLWLHPPVLAILFLVFSILRLCGVVASWWPAGWSLFGVIFFIINIRLLDRWLKQVNQEPKKNLLKREA